MGNGESICTQAPGGSPHEFLPAQCSCTAPPLLLLAPGGSRCALKGVNNVGSGRHNDFILEDPTVALTHAVVDDCAITDLSAGRTWVNGEQFSGSLTLSSGDTVQFGDVKCSVQGLEMQSPPLEE
mmetsp:Transcript_47193/g.102728  ORF Transcript_47193/g.102728 Transcript_47193/m.102728 type:complete len:125 (-) Transcript_47193:181-555(-)